jgi:hypothetical protein
MDELDPGAIIYGKSRKDRRKADDPSYKGPERRLGKKREKQLHKVIRQLEREAKSE